MVRVEAPRAHHVALSRVPYGTNARHAVPFGTYVRRKGEKMFRISGKANPPSQGNSSDNALFSLNDYASLQSLALAQAWARIQLDRRHGLLESTCNAVWREHICDKPARNHENVLFVGASDAGGVGGHLRQACSHQVDEYLASRRAERRRFRHYVPLNEKPENGENLVEAAGPDADPMPVPENDERLNFLANAARRQRDARDPLQELEAAVRADAIKTLGGETAIGRSILSEEDLVEALAAGFPADVLDQLRKAGYSYAVLEQVVAPRRTLMRRKSAQQRLTRSESDAAWRLAHVLSLGSRVFDGPKAALAWLNREKGSFMGRSPIDLLETSVGTAYVERILRSLDWGDVA